MCYLIELGNTKDSKRPQIVNDDLPSVYASESIDLTTPS